MAIESLDVEAGVRGGFRQWAAALTSAAVLAVAVALGGCAFEAADEGELAEAETGEAIDEAEGALTEQGKVEGPTVPKLPADPTTGSPGATHGGGEKSGPDPLPWHGVASSSRKPTHATR